MHWRLTNNQLLKVELAKYFAVKDEGKMEEYVGCSVMRDVAGNIVLHQLHLIKKIQLEFGDEIIDVRTLIMPASPGSLVVRMTNNKKLNSGLKNNDKLDIVLELECCCILSSFQDLIF